MYTAVVTRALVFRIPCAEMRSVIGSVNYVSIIINSFFFKCFYDSSKITVKTVTTTEIIRIFRFPVPLTVVQISRSFKVFEFFFTSFRSFIMFMVVLVMRFYMTNKEEKRSVGVSIFYKINCKIRYSVRPVTAKVNPAVIYIKYITVIAV